MQNLGKTSSGKVISASQDILNHWRMMVRMFHLFSPEDLFETYCLLEYLSARALNVTFEKDWAEAFREGAKTIRLVLLGENKFTELKLRHKLLYSPQFITFGKTFATKAYQS